MGDNCCIHQGVTLGGTGKVRGDRHPKLGNEVSVGRRASVLGNIVVGQGAVITACSVVTKSVLPYSFNTGVPSKATGYLACEVDSDAPTGVQHARYLVVPG